MMNTKCDCISRNKKIHYVRICFYVVVIEKEVVGDFKVLAIVFVVEQPHLMICERHYPT